MRVNDRIYIDESEFTETFVRASGPGGQNVNKVSTAVQLRFNAMHSAALPDELKARLRAVAGSRLTESGELIIEAKRFRSQERNREDARERLIALLLKAAEQPKPRKPTRPSRGAKERRLAAKSQRAQTKALRGPVRSGD